VKSFSISCAVRAARLGCALLLATLVGCASSGPTPRALGELINPSLGPDYSDWMVGAASQLATPEEITQFISLSDDTAAARFVEDFWARRNSTPNRQGNPLRQAFEERSGEADHLYSESEVRGRHTDRGTTLILYGPPRKISFDVAQNPLQPPIEVWTYGHEHSAGIHGKQPPNEVRFSKRGDLTVFYSAGGTHQQRPVRHSVLPEDEPPPP
jgi:GWxTD domain-containing protein